MKLSMIGVAAIACLVAACASSMPPTELRNARSAYQDAAQSPGASLAAPDVYEARKSLAVAEKAFSEYGDDEETRDLAYVAQRKALIAKSRGNAAILVQQKEQALRDAEQWRQQQAVAAREQLGQTKNQLMQTQQQLESERQARIAAEQRTADAIIKIQGLQSKQDQRGLVVTLNGSVLFASGKSELLPTARKRLDDVIQAVKDDPRSITIAGHTDSVGSDDTNMRLSQKRADAVRMYFIAHGIPEDRVTAVGMGENEPVADNKTAEGRANNRRVEVILNGSADNPRANESPGNSQPPSGSQQ